MISGSDIFTAAHLLDPRRLTLARELRGLTKAELAGRVDKTAVSIGLFERGEVRPEPRTLKALALALGLPLAFFAPREGSDAIPLEQCHFRSLRSASQRQRRRLAAVGSILVDFAELLGELVDSPHALNIPRVPRVVDDLRRVEEAAEQVRAAWGRGDGPIDHVVRLLERNGVLVVRVAGEDRAVDAFSCWHRGRPCVFLNIEKDSASRARFDAAHELGHLVLHEDVAAGDKQREREADMFASAFLLPRAAMLRELPTRFRWEHYLELKQRWKVSLAALVRRSRDLGRLSEAAYRRANIQLRRHGYPEPAEPPMELPQFFPRAFEASGLDPHDPRLAERIGLSAAELLALVNESSGTYTQLLLPVSPRGGEA